MIGNDEETFSKLEAQLLARRATSTDFFRIENQVRDVENHVANRVFGCRQATEIARDATRLLRALWEDFKDRHGVY